MQTITILGATGSIGTSTLDIVRHNPQDFQVFALTAHTRVDEMVRLSVEFKPRYIVMVNAEVASQVQCQLDALGLQVEVLFGAEALVYVSSHANVDTVMAAIVGIAGLAPTYAAVEAGKKVLLANKEALVTAGHIFMEAVDRCGASLIPIDSEHNAIFQAMPSDAPIFDPHSMEKVIITASGGPFRDMSLSQLTEITPQQACAHPNWSMGYKISIDSSTMVNKALEVIEAYWLFKVPVEAIEVIIHPQSIIHSMVKYVDGSYIAQLGSPDMRTPINYGLYYPIRHQADVKALDWFAQTLSFKKLDFERFKAVKLVLDNLQSKNYAANIVFNAANEVLVEAFVQHKVKYLDIIKYIEQALNDLSFDMPQALEDVYYIDKQTRSYVSAEIAIND